MIKKILLFLFLIIPVFANAGGVVRDVETEQAFKMFNSEIEKEMNKSRDKITYRLILDDTFNAMVMGGKNIYYNSGLILDIKTLDEFVAVSAHEMAHIKNGDLDKVANAYEKSKKLGAYGMAAAVLGGLAASSGDAVIGGVTLSSQISQRSFFKFVRGQEKAADATAFQVLRKLKYSPRGVVKVQKKLLDRMGYVSKNQSYDMTHPTSQDRLDDAKHEYKISPYKNNQLPKKWHKTFARIKAKLYGYTKPKDAVFGKYPTTNNSDNAIYARSMYYFAKQSAKKAVKEIKKLVNKYPNDVYYNESYATLLALDGQYQKAIDVYKKILKTHRKHDMFWIEYARILTAKGGKKNFEEAEYALFRAKSLNNEEPYLYRIMIGLYSKTKKEGKRLLARSEESFLMGNPNALELAKQAKKKLKKNSPEYNRAEDIIFTYEKGK